MSTVFVPRPNRTRQLLNTRCLSCLCFTQPAQRSVRLLIRPSVRPSMSRRHFSCNQPIDQPTATFKHSDTHSLPNSGQSQIQQSNNQSNNQQQWYLYYFSLGANLGNRYRSINQAFQLINQLDNTRVLDSGYLYETTPMLQTNDQSVQQTIDQSIDQPSFLNTAISVISLIEPSQMLDRVLSIESTIGRSRENYIRWGPRVVDIDMLFVGSIDQSYHQSINQSFETRDFSHLRMSVDYNQTIKQTINQSNLIVPHPRLHERRFVTRILRDFAPHLIHQSSNQTINQIDDQLSHDRSQDLNRVFCIPYGGQTVSPSSDQSAHAAMSSEQPNNQSNRSNHQQSSQITDQMINQSVNQPINRSIDPAITHNDGYLAVKLGARTLLMGILNMTPDSFSDGGSYNQSINQSINHALEMINSGVDIIDIGGASTRPGSINPSIDEETNRVIPVIKALHSRFPHLIMSIDTFNQSVADQSIKSGVSIVNDVSGGLIDRSMLHLIARSNIPYIMMHMRGTPQTMTKLNKYSNNQSINQSIKDELNDRLNDALSAGIPRWQIMIDPGVGFAKNGDQNIAVLGDLASTLPDPVMPMLVGTSRKRFLADIITKDRATYQSNNQSVDQSNNQSTNQSTNQSIVDNESRDWATAATSTICISQGVDVLRVHRVKGMRENIAVADAIYRSQQNRYK